MTPKRDLSRRRFLRGVGASAVVGAAGAGSAAALPDRERSSGTRSAPPGRAEYDFDEVVDRVGTDSVRWDRAIERFGPGIVAGMGVADMDFRAPPFVAEALAERCAHENWGYLARPDSYAEAVAEWNGHRYGLEVDPASVVFTAGVNPALIAALHTFSPPGSRVLLTTPAYAGFYTDIEFARTVAEDCPLIETDGRYSIDFDDFERRARRCSAFILCNPQNPTGNCWSPEELTRMGEICLRHRVVVLADEIHCDFVTRGNRYTPFASLDDRDVVANGLTFQSASKSFSLAAMKVAWYHATNPDLLERVKSHTRADLNTLGMVATKAALDHGEPWLAQLLAYLDANHDFTADFVAERMPALGFVKGEGTYLAWLDARRLIERIGARETARAEGARSSEDVTPETVLQGWFAQEAGVYLNPGTMYGTGGSGHMRMNLASPKATVERALENMAAAIDRLG